MSLWARFALIAVGGFTVLWRLSLLGWIGVVGHRRGEQLDREGAIALLIGWGPLIFFGITCVIVGIFPTAHVLLYVAAGVLIVGAGLSWWYRRWLERQELRQG